MNRVRIIVLLIALVALATVAVGCGGSGDDPGEILDNASLDTVKSGNLDFALNVTSRGEEGGSVDVRLNGPFRRRGKEFPLVDLTATVEGTANGEAIDFKGGLTLLPDRAFVNYEGTEYEVDPSSFSFAGVSFLPFDPNPTQAERGVSAIGACQEAAAHLDVGDLGDDLSNDGSANVDGTSTTKISGDLDVAAAFEAIVKLAKNPSCSAQLKAAGRSAGELEEVADELTGNVKVAHVEVYVGADDIIRKIVGELTAEPEGSDYDKVGVDFELTLSEVNEDPEIKTPSAARSIYVLLQGLGVSSSEAFTLVTESGGPGRLLDTITADIFPSGEG